MPGNGTGLTAAEAEENGSYRKIDVDDVKTVPNSNMVREKPDNCPDGAGEKMLEDDAKKLVAKSDLADVKFVSDKNGDTKVDIQEMKQAFTGLTKEELMKYCNDPFWVRLRWFMFILFWVLWLGMLLGAVYIIVQAPKCAPPAPKTWWQNGPIIDLDDTVAPVEAEGYFKDLEDKLPLFDSFKGMFVPEIFNSGGIAYATPQPSEIAHFRNFSEKAKKRDIRLIVDLTPNYLDKANAWFVLSENRTEPYSDYFIWRKATKYDENGEPFSPTNWMSTHNTSAWTYSPNRKEFYLHQFGANTPDLNFRNPKVLEEFDRVIRFWIENGAGGVRLDKVKHLLVKETFQDEPLSREPTDHSNYDFLVHTDTMYQDGLCEILSRWKGLVRNLTDNEGLLTLKENIIGKVNHFTCNNELVVDLPRSTKLLMADSGTLTAKQLQKSIDQAFVEFGPDSWPAWQFKTKGGEMASEFRIITSLLPGVPIFSINELFTNADNKTEVDPEYTTLIKLRSLPSMLNGVYSSNLLSNNSLFSYTRLKSGNPGFVVLYNPTSSALNANMTVLPKMPPKVKVNHLSKNYNSEGVAVKAEIPSDNVTVSSKSAMILTYVQKE